MAIAYVFSFILGLIFLAEPATLTKVIGILFIIAGCIFMGLPSKKRSDQTGEKTTQPGEESTQDDGEPTQRSVA
jgi:drug/metabolite transporter (DMT)-like permease